jgi:hypothetical protein
MAEHQVRREWARPALWCVADTRVHRGDHACAPLIRNQVELMAYRIVGTIGLSRVGHSAGAHRTGSGAAGEQRWGSRRSPIGDTLTQWVVEPLWAVS